MINLPDIFGLVVFLYFLANLNNAPNFIILLNFSFTVFSKEFVKPIVLIIVSLSLVHGGAVKCTGLIGFSSTGAVLVHSSGLVRFRTNHVDSGHGWVSDTGAFTVHCTGIYHLSYTAYGDSKTKFVLIYFLNLTENPNICSIRKSEVVHREISRN